MKKQTFSKYWKSLTADEKRQFAVKCESTPGYLRHFVDDRIPGPLMAIKIEKASGGVVSKESLRPDIFKG